MEQVKNLLNRARQLYDELAKHYETLEKSCHRKRVEMLLEYLKDHAKGQTEVLAEFEKSASSALQNDWVNFSPSPEKWHLAVQENLSAEDTRVIVEEALSINEAIIDIYREIACNAESKATKDLFVNLESRAKKERNRFVRDAMMMEDC